MRLLIFALLAACDADPATSPDAATPADNRTLQTDDGGAVMYDLSMPALPAHCPCPLGSYCDLATNACKRGCLGNDHCPADQRCDSSVFACTLICDHNKPNCPNNLACASQHGAYICTGCVDHFDDCNGDPFDGCETKLDSLTNCGACGKPATAMCSLDMDGDGYILKGSAILECNCSPGRGTGTSEDCDDNDFQVHPGVSSFFDMPRKSGGFDYNCDGKETPEVELTVSDHCPLCAGTYWVNSAPGCGATGSEWACEYDSTADKCDQATWQIVQKCR